MSKPRNIFLVRHGLSTGNVDRSAYKHKPDWKIELDEKGHLQAEEVGKNLRELMDHPLHWKAAFYVSPYVRTKQTLSEILKSFDESKVYSIKEDPRLREQEYGTGKSKATEDSFMELEKEKIECGPFFYRMPNGESPADIFDRMTTFLDTLHRDFKKDDFPENVVIVTHGMAMRVFLMRWFHWTVDHFHKVRNPDNCGIYHMELQDNGKYILKTELKLRE
jgi:broad specificity phosphatase PhoE